MLVLNTSSVCLNTDFTCRKGNHVHLFLCSDKFCVGLQTWERQSTLLPQVGILAMYLITPLVAANLCDKALRDSSKDHGVCGRG